MEGDNVVGDYNSLGAQLNQHSEAFGQQSLQPQPEMGGHSVAGDCNNSLAAQLNQYPAFGQQNPQPERVSDNAEGYYNTLATQLNQHQGVFIQQNPQQLPEGEGNNVGSNSLPAAQLNQHQAFEQQNPQPDMGGDNAEGHCISPAAQLNQHQGAFIQQNPQQLLEVGGSNVVGYNCSLAAQLNQQNPQQLPEVEDGRNPLHDDRGQTGSILPLEGTSQQHSLVNNRIAAPTKYTHTVWQGILDFQEKTTISQGLRVSMNGTFISKVTTTGESFVNADEWPNRLRVNLIPRRIRAVPQPPASLPKLRASFRHVVIRFSRESDALKKLLKNRNPGMVGWIKFPTICDIRIMLISYTPSKQIYMGSIPLDQEDFMHNIKLRYDNYRKRQRPILLANIPPSDGSIGNQPANPSNPHMMPQQPIVNNTSNNNQMNVCMPVNHQQQQQPPQQVPGQVNLPQQSSSLDHLEAPGQYDLLEQQLELQYQPLAQHQPSFQVMNLSQQHSLQLQQQASPLMYNQHYIFGRSVGTVLGEGTYTASPSPQSSQETPPSVDANLVEAQASEIFGKEIVQKLLTATGERFYSIKDLCDEILKHEERSKREVSEELLCKVCLDQRLGIAFEPCGHLATCQECAKSLTKCPMCRTMVSKKMKIYM